MANVNDGKILGRMTDDGNQKGFPNTTAYHGTTGKKVTAFLTAVVAGMLVISSITNLFPNLPRVNRGFRDRNDRPFNGKKVDIQSGVNKK